MKSKVAMWGMNSVGAAVAMVLAAPVMAQSAPADEDVLETITVTAERRSSDIQSTPVAITALDGDKLEAAGRDNLTDVLRTVPGVIIQQTGLAGQESITVRGIAAGNRQDSAATMYLDNVPVSGSYFGFHDIDRVEVLRGPQGTLYGRNSSGGAINVVTNNPTSEVDATAQLELGSYSLVHASAMGNVPLSDDLAARVSFNTINRNGYLNTGQDDDVETNIRTKVRYAPSDDFSIILGAIYYRLGGKGPGQLVSAADIPDDPYNSVSQSRYAQNSVRNQYYNYYANLQWNLGFATLTAIPAYQGAKPTSSQVINGMREDDYSNSPNQTHTLEVRLGASADSKIQWVVGGFLLHETKLLSQDFFFDDIGSAAFGTYVNNGDSKSAAAFGEVTVPLSETLRVTGGLRYTKDDRKWYASDDFGSDGVDVVEYNYSKSFNNTDYKIRLEKNLTDKNLVYAGVSSGYRAGGYSAFGRFYDPETVTAYLLGSKNRFLSDRLQINAEAYYYDYGGFQVGTGIFANGAPVDQLISTLPARFYGLDLENAFLITNQDRLDATIGYEKGRFHDLDTVILANGSNALAFYGGEYTPYTPLWTLSGTYDHDFRLSNGSSLSFSSTWTYRSSQYMNVQQTEKTYNAAHTIGDVMLGYKSADQKFSLNLYAKNVTDEVYKANATGQAMNLNAPRTFGLVATMRL